MGLKAPKSSDSVSDKQADMPPEHTCIVHPVKVANLQHHELALLQHGIYEVVKCTLILDLKGTGLKDSVQGSGFRVAATQ